MEGIRMVKIKLARAEDTGEIIKITSEENILQLFAKKQFKCMNTFGH